MSIQNRLFMIGAGGHGVGRAGYAHGEPGGRPRGIAIFDQSENRIGPEGERLTSTVQRLDLAAG